MTQADDRFAIYDVCVKYATSLDARDWEGFRGIWLPDCDVHYPGDVHLKGAEEVTAYCDRALSRFRITQHFLGNHRVSVEGDTARSVIDLQATHVFSAEAGGAIFTLGGTYTDDLIRTPEGWRIKMRTLTTTWTETSSPA